MGFTNSKSTLKGAVAGAIGGVAGAGAMLLFGAVWMNHVDEGQPADKPVRPPKFLPLADHELEATMLLARWIFTPIARRELTGEEIIRIARYVHFAFGAMLGATFGALVEQRRLNSVAGALAFTSAEELIGNEFLMPRLGYLKQPHEYPTHERWNSFLGHLVFGASMELSRRAMRKQL